MKKSKGFLCFISILLLLSLLTLPVLAQTEPSTVPDEESSDLSSRGCFSADAKEAFLGDGQLVKNAESAFLYELNTQTLMYAWQPDLALSPSSFAKILTAIVAIEHGDLNSAVTVTESALADLPGSAVSVDLQINEVLTLNDLLYCMIVGSGNDAAAVIAQHIGGSQAGFAELMNHLASNIGCTGSHFTNPHGLHDPQQVTTARDTVKILAYAMQNETFRTIFSTSEFTVPATNKSQERNLLTGNYMMSMEEVEIYFDERVVGGRTGVANDRTRCLATVARSGSMELLCVVMGSASVYEEGGSRIRSYGGYNETKTLLDVGFTGYTASRILYDGQALMQYDVVNGDSFLTVGPHSSVLSVLPDNATLDDITFRYSNDSGQLRAPISVGDKVSTVEVWFGDLLLGTTDLYAMNDVRDQSVIMLCEKEKSYIWVIVVILVTVVVLAAVAVFLWRSGIGRKYLYRFRRKRLKRNRRR